METIIIRSVRKIIQNKPELERKLKVKIIVKGQTVSIDGEAFNEFLAEKVIRALDYPFSIDEATLLLDEDYLFEVINIKSQTKRKDLKVIKGRIIGSQGRTLRVLRELTNSCIVVKDNDVAIIARSADFENVVQSIKSLIHGSKQGNVYSYLEKANKRPN